MLSAALLGLRLLVSLGVLGVFCPSAVAVPDPVAPPVGESVPASIAGVTTLDAQGVLHLAHQQPALLLIDSRLPADRVGGFIPGSLNLADIDTDCTALRALGASDERAMLFFGNGVLCGRSVRAVLRARRCGFKRLYWYREGFADWVKQDLPLAYPMLSAP